MKPASTPRRARAAHERGTDRAGRRSRRSDQATRHQANHHRPPISGRRTWVGPLRRSPAGQVSRCSPSLAQPLGRDADPEGSGLLRLGKLRRKFKTPDSPPVVANRREFGTCADSLRHHPTDVEPGSNNLTQGPQRVAKTPDWERQQPCRTGSRLRARAHPRGSTSQVSELGKIAGGRAGAASARLGIGS